MTKIDLIKVLDEAYYEDFLDSVLVIKRNEKEYKLSDYYKETKIPLMELYKNYYQYKKSEDDLIGQLTYWFDNLDEAKVEEKIASVITKLRNNEDLKEFFANFSLDRLEEQKEELEGALKDLK